MPRLQTGCDPAAPPLRVYLTGELALEAGERLVHEARLPGPQGRHLLALLISEHGRAVGLDELAEELWGPAPPAAWRTSIKALSSRLRRALSATGLDGAELLAGAPGVYRFRLPAGAWVDIDAALSATHAAEALLAGGDPARAGREALVARIITARPLLPGRTGPWVERRRAQLAAVRIRALECSARARIELGLASQAVRDMQLALEVEPLREPAWRLLMDAHAAAGDTASALAAYERCRALLAERLGVGPSAPTRRHHSMLLAGA